MPEVISRLDTGLPLFPAGAGKGSVFSPLPQDMDKHTMRAHTLQTINAPRLELYKLWRDTELAPRWQEFVISATPTGEKTAHWVMGDPDDPKGKRIEYDTEITEDRPGEAISWRSITNDIEETGRVTFEDAPGGRGTRVTLIEFATVPGGRLGNALAALDKRTPRQIVKEDLRHFKQLAESGEIPTVARNPHGPRGLIGSFKSRLYGENNPTPAGTSRIG
jgi:uncharacterized membrane protein